MISYWAITAPASGLPCFVALPPGDETLVDLPVDQAEIEDPVWLVCPVCGL